MPTRHLSALTSTSSSLAGLDQLWDSSLSQSQPASADSSFGSVQSSRLPKPCPPRKRRRLLASASSSSLLRLAGAAASSSGSDAELDATDEDEDASSLADELDIVFSASLSLPTCTPLAEPSLRHQDALEFTLVMDALLSDGTSSDNDAGSSSSDEEAEVGWSEAGDDQASSFETVGQAADESQPGFMTRDMRRAQAKAYIEDLLLSVLRHIVAYVDGLSMEARSESDDGVEDSSRPWSSDTLRLPCGPASRYFIWPKRRGSSANSKQLARIWQVLALMHHGLDQGTTSTKRELFYADPGLFGSQTAIVDRMIASSGLRRGDFGVIASPKGLFASTVIDIVLADDEGMISSQGLPTLIPPSETIDGVVMADEGDLDDSDDDEAVDAEPQLILVIEKDATFQALCEKGWGAGQVVLVTGKGFPDLATRHFVALLARRFPSTPIYGLFDGDPDGIEILSCYRFGSRTQACSAEERELPVERMQWLGVKPSEWGRLYIDWNLMIPLTARDHRKITSMLARPPERLPEAWRRELCHMQHLRRKAEIQLLQRAAQTPSEQPAMSLFGPEGHGAETSVGGVDRLVAYLDAKTGRGGSHDALGHE